MKDILIVEDGRPERERLQKLFSEAGYAVQACESVGEAEKALQHEEFRLGILDIGLNDRSGSYLFSAIKRQGSVSFVIIFTGNPSVHLKQRFIDEGAVDYIVKGSPQAQNEAFLGRVREIIGEAQAQSANGISLDEFVQRYIPEKSRSLFYDMNNSFPSCPSCKSDKYIVTFAHQPQVPPEVTGKVICADCGRAMDPEIE
ncbi:MAG: response regulator [Bdellovibrionales bacterium]|nr:response regulator [Bdellovibrionales bacterium]